MHNLDCRAVVVDTNAHVHVHPPPASLPRKPATPRSSRFVPGRHEKEKLLSLYRRRHFTSVRSPTGARWRGAQMNIAEWTTFALRKLLVPPPPPPPPLLWGGVGGGVGGCRSSSSGGRSGVEWSGALLFPGKAAFKSRGCRSQSVAVAASPAARSPPTYSSLPGFSASLPPSRLSSSSLGRSPRLCVRLRVYVCARACVRACVRCMPYSAYCLLCTV